MFKVKILDCYKNEKLVYFEIEKRKIVLSLNPIYKFYNISDFGECLDICTRRKVIIFDIKK